MKSKKFGLIFLSVCLCLFGAAIIIYPERYVSRCFEGFLLWAECVLPSLFPFMIIALALIKSGAAEKVSLPLSKLTRPLNLPQNAAICFILSIFSGYPAGSKVLAEFYESGALDSDDCKKLAPLCSTSGPLFIIGSVGYKMFGDKSAGIKIFLAHAAAVIIISVILALLKKKSNPAPQKTFKSSQNAIYETFYGAVISVAVAGGFIAFFYTFSQFLYDFNVFLPLEKLLSPIIGATFARAALMGLAEATTGCSLLAAGSGYLKIPLAGFIITFGGLSILLQQLGHLKKTGVSAAKFAAVKFLQGALCFLILLVIPQ